MGEGGYDNIAFDRDDYDDDDHDYSTASGSSIK